MFRLRNLETFYGPLQALFGLSLDVEQGSIVTILGANGAGKSTILKTSVGLLKDQPEKGTIEFEGKRIDGCDTADIVRRGIAYVPEGREVFPELTISENLQIGAYLRKDRRQVAEDIERMLEMFPVLAKRTTQLAGTLSGGEQQMLAIARGLMSKPKLLMLDEPSLGLAPALVKEIFAIIKAINQQGMTILLVEQNARLALETAQHGFVLENGRIVMDDKCSALLANEDVQEFYLGQRKDKGASGQQRYKRKKRWN
ncbi:MAG: ABC transporter ATP-binding protein [Deltaproteobacteria bacterium]|nr:ABC transporter ATP-binding protein [Deltaproteobacteria bacterium]